MELWLMELHTWRISVNAMTSYQYLLWERARTCWEKDTPSFLPASSAVTRALERKPHSCPSLTKAQKL